MKSFAPNTVHEDLLKNAPLVLSYKKERNFETWRDEVDSKLRELVGWAPESVALNLRIEGDEQRDGYRETRFLFAAEENADVPCHLLVPDTGDGPFPVVICLQGHSTGMHISLGVPKFEGDQDAIDGDRDFGVQAVREGYAALVIEQRCFGERIPQRADGAEHFGNRCQHAAMVSLLLGRTMIGERCYDLSRAIDVLEGFDAVDTSRIGCMGNSGGGTITWFASCLEPRISVAMPSCYVCTFRDSIGMIDHCPDNYIPGIMRWFEMGDMAALIAPRPLVVVAGREDGIFPISGVEETFARIQEIYNAAGAPDNCRLVVGEGGHRFYAQEAWPVFRDISRWS
jgi:cephalosporin-C deacetylase-like acetyl esterase